MSFTTDLVDGLGHLLAAAGVGLVYDTAPGTGQTRLYAMTIPQSPDQVVTLSPFPLTADTTLSQSLMGLQVRSRAAGEDVRVVWALDDAVQDVLLGNYPLTLSTGIQVKTIDYQGGGSLGQDEKSRWMWGANYHLNVYRPGPHRH